MAEPDDGDHRVKIVHELTPADWDTGPLLIAHELRQMLKAIADSGSNIDSGGGDGCADLWVKIQDVEYHIAISKSNAQKQSESKA